MTCPVLANSVDPDQLASEEANWSGSALFVIKYVNFYKKTKIKLSDWLEIRSGCGILIYSAWQGLMIVVYFTLESVCCVFWEAVCFLPLFLSITISSIIGAHQLAYSIEK